MQVRRAIAEDAAAIQAIYAWHVENGTGTFEETPPSVADFHRRMAEVARHGLSWFVAEADGRVLGYAYATPFRLRSAYRFTAEDSVYVAHDAGRRGIGRAVLSAVVEACAARGLRQLLAVIGGADNAGSIGLHSALGFEHVGSTPALGWKQGRWHDVVWMQKALNGGAHSQPLGDGLPL